MGGRTALSMWRITAAAALVFNGFRSLLDVSLDLKTLSGSHVFFLCVAEIALVAALGIEQPTKWWIALIMLGIYFVVPVFLMRLLSNVNVLDKVHLQQKSAEIIQEVVQSMAVEFSVVATAIGLLAAKVHTNTTNKPIASLVIAVVIACVQLLVIFTRLSRVTSRPSVKNTIDMLINYGSKIKSMFKSQNSGETRFRPVQTKPSLRF